MQWRARARTRAKDTRKDTRHRRRRQRHKLELRSYVFAARKSIQAQLSQSSAVQGFYFDSRPLSRVEGVRRKPETFKSTACWKIAVYISIWQYIACLGSTRLAGPELPKTFNKSCSELKGLRP